VLAEPAGGERDIGEERQTALVSRQRERAAADAD
jgi:hypothetical protein